ncbi:hypothetical protein IFT92_24720 [Peribacillus simplex]|nr:hypothetical protein [Peribacillus simplex]NCT35349.1 hypothetical protein [Peribacillus frigoritolerans]
MLKKVVLAGGTGFVGQYFEKHFRNIGIWLNSDWEAIKDQEIRNSVHEY